MSLKEQLMVDLKDAMKNKDKKRKDTITMVRASIKQREVDERIDLDDAAVLDIISKEVKERRASIEEFRKGDRQDLIDETEKEIEILLNYLPEQLSEEELESMVRKIIDANSIQEKSQMGLLMKEIMPKIKGRADGKLVNKIAAKILN